MIVVDAQTTANVKVLELEALSIDLLDELTHDYGSIPEDVDLGDGGAQVTVHTHQLYQGLSLDGIKEPLQWHIKRHTTALIALALRIVFSQRNWSESCGGCCTAQKLCSDLSHIQNMVGVMLGCCTAGRAVQWSLLTYTEDIHNVLKCDNNAGHTRCKPKQPVDMQSGSSF